MTLFLISIVFRIALYEFAGKVVTPWGGMVFLKQFLEQIKFSEQVATCPHLPQPGSNRGYTLPVLLASFICSVWCGATKFLHTEQTRADRVPAKIFDWKCVPGQDAYRRFFSKFTQVDNLRTADYFLRWLLQSYQYNNFTPDFDSSVPTRYGHREGAKRGYNPQKWGRSSHHPLIAFINDLHLVANVWLRSGDTGASNNFLSFLENTMEKLENKKVSLIRLDSGFCSDEIMNCPESKSLNYIIAAKFYHPVQRLIAGNENRMLPDEGIEICEKTYRGQKWKIARRPVIARQKISVRPQAAGKTLSLFPDHEQYRNCQYSTYFIGMAFAPTEVWRLYCERGDVENRIREIKYDFGFDSFNLKDFYAAEAALIFSIIACSLMSIFRMSVLQEKTQRRLSTLRFRIFTIGAYFQKVDDRPVLMIVLTKKRRRWFDDLWNYPLKLPLCPNA
ncbi:MAG: IS1380 family transposase [Prevotellaceae bacterium]|jgi:hypothetical protein|nr:IS1380 family transposase [Prevotellaceae bacterium]